MKFSDKSFSFRVSLVALLLLSASISMLSQNRLLEPSLSTFSTLNVAENQRLTKIQASGMYTSYFLVDFGNLAQMQNEGKISINIPDDECEDLVFKVSSVKYVNEQDYYWYGELQSTSNENDCYCRLGNITLISSQYGRIGYISIDDKTFELLELSSSRFVLGKLDGSKFTDAECGVTSKTLSVDPSDMPDIQSRENGNCDVRCLVLYTNNALDAEGGLDAINNRVNLAIAQTNQALSNSSIDVTQLRIELAGVQPLIFTETQIMRTDVFNLANNIDAQILRNAFEADIVVLLTDGDYGNSFGIVEMIGPNNGTSYSIVQTGAATTGRFTFAHEVAHLFGGGHNDDPRPGIPHGHNFKTGNFIPCIFGKKQRTILNLADAGDVRIQHYSNPQVYYDGKKTGVSGSKDNSQQLRNTSCSVSQFRETIRPFNVFITGDINTCPCGSASLVVNIFGGTSGATYTYFWEKSMDGINWTAMSTNSTAYIPPTAPPHHNCPEEDYIFVRVHVVSSDNQQGNAFATITRVYQWPGQVEPCYNQPLIKNEVIDQVTIFPNPTIGHTESAITLSKKGKFTIRILNSTGRIVTTIAENQELEMGTHTFSFDLRQSGLFFVNCISETGEQIVSKFIKL